MFVREDGAQRSVFISQGKAAASAAFMQPSSKLAEGGPNPIHQGLMAMLGGRMIPVKEDYQFMKVILLLEL